MKGINLKDLDIKLTMGALGAAGLGIGIWLFMLFSASVSTVTRGSVVIFHPPAPFLILGTALMLSGVALIAIQVATVYERLHKVHQPEHKPFSDRGFGSH